MNSIDSQYESKKRKFLEDSEQLRRDLKKVTYFTEVANVCVCVCVGVLITNCYDDKSPSRNDMRINKHLRVAAHRLRKFFVDGCYAQLLLNILTGTSPLQHKDKVPAEGAAH